MKPIYRLCGLLVVILTFIPVHTFARSANTDNEQKAVLVTGASTGIGGKITEVLASDDTEEITAMVNKFLGSSDQKQAHVDFWADELVYTSSNGTRFGKAEILAGFEQPDEEQNSGPAMAYTGEDMNVQLYGTTAIVTFKLVGTPDDGSAVKYYFNTGTFIKRAGEWRAVAWQATVIPGA